MQARGYREQEHVEASGTGAQGLLVSGWRQAEWETLGDTRVGRPGSAAVKASGLHQSPDDPSHWDQEQLSWEVPARLEC